MAWIRVVDEADAEGKLQEYYDQIKRVRGKVAHIMKVHSLNPEAMKKHLELYVAIMFGPSGLSREQRELIATVVSSVNRCDYCVHHHAEALHFYWKDRAKLQLLIRDPTQVKLPKKEEIMLEYAVKLTKNPASVSESDIHHLRSVGFSDEEILQINLITSYFNFVNRVAEGLGVEFTAEEVKGYTY
jgi:uncharacterized peroxidase-related enzyme